VSQDDRDPFKKSYQPHELDQMSTKRLETLLERRKQELPTYDMKPDSANKQYHQTEEQSQARIKELHDNFDQAKDEYNKTQDALQKRRIEERIQRMQKDREHEIER